MVVAGDVIAAGKYFEKSDALEHLANTHQTSADFRRFQIVQNIGAHDEVEAGIETQLLQLAKARQSDLATAAVTGHHVFTGIQPR